MLRTKPGAKELALVAPWDEPAPKGVEALTVYVYERQPGCVIQRAEVCVMARDWNRMTKDQRLDLVELQLVLYDAHVAAFGDPR